MENKTVIRPITECDVAGAADALLKVHMTDGYPVEGVRDPAAWITAPGICQAWVAVSGNQVVGHVGITRPHDEDAVDLWRERSGKGNERIGVLCRLFVIPGGREQATGEKLMRTAMSHAHDRGLRLVLDVMVKDTAAIRLYERLGWLKIAETTHHYSGDQQIPAVCYVWPSEDSPLAP